MKSNSENLILTMRNKSSDDLVYKSKGTVLHGTRLIRPRAIFDLRGALMSRVLLLQMQTDCVLMDNLTVILRWKDPN